MGELLPAPRVTNRVSDMKKSGQGQMVLWVVRYPLPKGRRQMMVQTPQLLERVPIVWNENNPA